MLVCVFLHNFAHETAGAARTRHSPRPLISRRESFGHNSGASRRGNAKSCTVISPPSTRSCAWRGGVGGGGSISLLLWQRVCGGTPHPRPLPTASRGGGRS